MRAIALDIQESGIKLLATNGNRVTHLSSIRLPHGLVKDGVIAGPELVGAHIKTLMREKGALRGKVIVCVSGVHCIPRVFSVPRIKPHLQQEAIRHQAERRMPVPLDQLCLSWQQLDGDGIRDRYFVVGVPQRSVESLVETMARAGIRNYSLDLKPMALARAVNARESVVLNLEPDNADVVLIANGIPEIMRSLPTGSDSAHQQDGLEDIGIQVTRTVEYYNSVHPEHPLDPEAPVFLTGSLARNQSVQTLLGKIIGDRITLAPPLLNCPVYMPVEEYTANIGLALGLGTPKGLKSHAVSPALSLGIQNSGYGPSRISNRKLLSMGAAALALALLVPVSMAVMQTRSETRLLAQELTTMETQLRDEVKAKAPLDNMRVEVARLQQERQEVLSSTGKFANRLDVVLDKQPDGLTPDSVKMTGDALIVEGGAEDFYQVTDFAAQMESAGLFSAVYPESLSSSKASESGHSATFRIQAEY